MSTQDFNSHPKIPTPQDVSVNKRHTPNEQFTQTNRPVGPGAGIHRGDRRDTHPSFSTGKGGRGSTAGKARDGGRSGPLGKSGRKSGPQSGDTE
jgi:hypothetical protein